MRRSKFREPKIVLVFNANRKLIDIAYSVNNLQKLTGMPSQSISHSCLGTHIMCKSYYLRHLHPNVEISLIEDLGKLDLIEYDKMCGDNNRYYYPKNILKIISNGKVKRKMTAKQLAALKKT